MDSYLRNNQIRMIVVVGIYIGGIIQIISPEN